MPLPKESIHGSEAQKRNALPRSCADQCTVNVWDRPVSSRGKEILYLVYRLIKTLWGIMKENILLTEETNFSIFYFWHLNETGQFTICLFCLFPYQMIFH